MIIPFQPHVLSSMGQFQKANPMKGGSFIEYP